MASLERTANYTGMAYDPDVKTSPQMNDDGKI